MIQLSLTLEEAKTLRETLENDLSALHLEVNDPKSADYQNLKPLKAILLCLIQAINDQQHELRYTANPEQLKVTFGSGLRFGTHPKRIEKTQA
jgi:hypothetical protein